MKLESVTSQDFKPALKQKFIIYGEPPVRVEAELVQVKDLPVSFEDDLDEDAAVPVRRKPFSLIFRSEQKNEYLPQKIYTVENETIGSLDIFLVPIGPDNTGMRYQAIFN